MLQHIFDVVTRDYRGSKRKMLKWLLIWGGFAVLCFLFNIAFFGLIFLMLAAPYAIVLAVKVRRDQRLSAMSYAPIDEPPTIHTLPTKSSSGSSGLKVPQSLNRDQ